MDKIKDIEGKTDIRDNLESSEQPQPQPQPRVAGVADNRPPVRTLKAVDLDEPVDTLEKMGVVAPNVNAVQSIEEAGMHRVHVEDGSLKVTPGAAPDSKSSPSVYAGIRESLANAQKSNKFLISVSYVSDNAKKENSFEHFFAVHNFPLDDIQGVMDHLKKDMVKKLKLDSPVASEKDLLGIDAWK